MDHPKIDKDIFNDWLLVLDPGVQKGIKHPLKH